MNEKLKTSEDRLSRIQRIGHIGGWDWDVTTNAVYWSDELYRIYGFEPHEVKPDYGLVLERMHPDSKDEFLAAIDAALKDEHPFEIDYKFLRKDGSEVSLHSIGEMYRDEGGVPVHMTGVVQDITEQKRIRQELQAAQEYSENLITTANAMVVGLDADGRVIVFNDTAERITGYSLSELQGRNWFEVIVPRDRYPEVWKEFERLTVNGIPKKFENPILTKSGEERFIIWRNNVIYAHGKIAETISFGIDITERKQTEETLRESEQKFRTIVDNANDGILILNVSERKFVEANESICKMLGYDREELINLEIADIHPRADVPRVLAEFERQMNGEKIISGGLPVLRKDGSIFYADIGAAVMMLGGKPHSVGIFRDITERKQSEEALKKSAANLKRAEKIGNLGNWEWDVATNELVWSDQMFRIYGLDPSNCTPSFEIVVETLPSEQKDDFMKAVQDALDHDKPFEGEYSVIRPDGSRKYTHAAGEVTRDADGNPVNMFGIVQDITERKLAEEKLRESEERFRTQFKSLPLPTYIWRWMGDDFLLEDFNEAAVSVTEGTISRFVGVKAKEFYSDNPGIAEDLALCLDGKKSIRRELDYHFKSDELEGLGTRTTDVTYAYVSPDRVMVHVEDITELKRADEKLKKSLADMRKAMGGVIKAFALTVESRDPYTSGHEQRVSDLARIIAKEMGLDHEQIEAIRFAATIHDLGKIQVPAEILSKPGALTPLEFEMIKLHPETGYQILKDVEFPWDIAQIVRQHHERLDGSGYPQGISGEDIKLETRIIAVADVVEAMSSHRPYRAAKGINAALDEIAQQSGILYDPDVADACLRLFREKRYELE